MGGEIITLYTKTALGKALGLSGSEVGNLTKAEIISYKTGKMYDLEDCAKAIIAHCKEKMGGGGTATADYATERALLMRAKRLEQEYETGLKEGRLHDAKDIELIVTKMLMNFRSRIMAVPSKLAPRLTKENDTNAIYEILKEAMDDALNELSDYDRLFGNNDDT